MVHPAFIVQVVGGNPEFWYTWRHQLSALADAGYRVVAPDLRGYNRSDAPPGVDSYRMAELVADVRGLIEHRGAPRAAVVGHDWGGLIAWECALRDPELLSQLVVLNAPHPVLYRRHLLRSPDQLLRSSYVFAAQVPWLPERLLALDGYRLLEESQALFPGAEAFTDEDIARYRSAMERPERVSGPLNYYRAAARETVEKQLQSLRPGTEHPDETVAVPTLVLWGERDPVLGVDLLDGLEDVVADLQICRLPDTSHWPHIERPQWVTEELLAFLQG